jgi:hypothetical protein
MESLTDEQKIRVEKEKKLKKKLKIMRNHVSYLNSEKCDELDDFITKLLEPILLYKVFVE